VWTSRSHTITFPIANPFASTITNDVTNTTTMVLFYNVFTMLHRRMTPNTKLVLAMSRVYFLLWGMKHLLNNQ
jgi:hypothetical protein